MLWTIDLYQIEVWHLSCIFRSPRVRKTVLKDGIAILKLASVWDNNKDFMNTSAWNANGLCVQIGSWKENSDKIGMFWASFNRF